MKSVLKIFGVVCLAFLAFSCSKDDDPADNDLFVGTYEGTIGYSDSGELAPDTTDGSVTVVKAGSSYNFSFNDSDIPNLTGVEFENDGDNGVINIGWDDTQIISINASELTIYYLKDGETWVANCSR